MLPLVRVYYFVASSHCVCHYSLYLREYVQTKVNVKIWLCLVKIELVLLE